MRVRRRGTDPSYIQYRPGTGASGRGREGEIKNHHPKNHHPPTRQSIGCPDSRTVFPLDFPDWSSHLSFSCDLSHPRFSLPSSSSSERGQDVESTDASLVVQFKQV